MLPLVNDPPTTAPAGATTTAPTTTTLPGSVILVPPGGKVNIVGPHNDSSDFFGLAFALVGIGIVIVVVRLAFRTRLHPSRVPEERRPGAPEPPPPNS